MKTLINSTFFSVAILIAFAGYAQKGSGEASGLSRQGVNPELVKLEGMIQAIEQGPCKYTTGKSTSGTHLILVTKDRTLNIHLGPTSEVLDFVANSENAELSVTAFRTNRLPKDHYIAKEFVLNESNIVLRDDKLKPLWADRYGKEKWRKNRKRGN